MSRCKAPEILRSEAYMDVRCNDEGRGERRRWAFFSSLLGTNYLKWNISIEEHRIEFLLHAPRSLLPALSSLLIAPCSFLFTTDVTFCILAQSRNDQGPHRLAWSRTPAFHAGNTGSNPVGDAINFQRLTHFSKIPNSFQYPYSVHLK